MSRPPLVPPLKCQGIKTKLVSAIQRVAETREYSRWIEPFCGSGVVALNVQPKKALLCDTNLHIISLYKDIQTRKITAASVKEFLTSEGKVNLTSMRCVQGSMKHQRPLISSSSTDHASTG
jgi:DNA adenine methylase